MKRKTIAGLVFVASIVTVTLIMWFAIPGISPSQSLAGLSGALGGMIGGVLGAVYLSRFRDERFTQIENRSAHNASIFLLIALPICCGIIALSETSTVQLAVGIVLGLWLIALAIHGISMVYYYRK